MARIPDAELTRLKHDIPLARLAAAKGVALKPSGANLIGLCPFHDDHEPSLVITPDKNLWHCLGACQQGGSVIDWVMKAEGVSFRHAVEILRTGDGRPETEAGAAAVRSAESEAVRSTELGAVRSSPATPPPKYSRIPKLPPLLTASAEDQDLLRHVLTHYQQDLAETPAALAYLAKRGLTSTELIAHFQVGFANRTLGYRLSAKTRLAGAELRGRLQTVGILRESGHEHLSGCIVIPIFDEHGHVSDLYGRKITHGLRPESPAISSCPARITACGICPRFTPARRSFYVKRSLPIPLALSQPGNGIK